MPRNQHTITQFKGIDTASSVANIPPTNALDCLNCYGDYGGWLTQFQQPSILTDFSSPGQPNVAPSLSMGVLPTPLLNPRLIFQQGTTLYYTDFPFSASTPYLHGVLDGLARRIDFALCNGILFGSNSQDTAYFVSAPSTPTTSLSSKTRFIWGILPPPAPTLVLASTSWIPGSITVQRVAGVTTVTFSAAHGSAPTQPVYVDSDPSAPWDATFTGLFPIATTPTPDSVTFAQPTLPDAGPYTRATYPSGITATTGWQYGASWGASIVAHFGSLSAYGLSTGPVTAQSPTILVAPSPDWQVDQSALFRNQDGGGDWFLVTTSKTILTGPYTGYSVYSDTLTDEGLAVSGQTAPYDNGVAPLAKYLAVWLDRVLACGISGDPTTVRYTGYDTINFGRPQMSWCQFNSIKLGQGQATPNGMGLLRYGGMVFFATNGLMYIYRGTLNDISVSAPVPLAFYAEQLPYAIGLYSHYSIQPTPVGLVWLDDGMDLKVLDNTGFYPPKPVAPGLAGTFKRMTPGTQDQISSVYINYLQRDWYVISICVDGSITPNLSIVVDLTADAAHATGSWPVQHSITDMAWVTYADQSSHLLALQSQLTQSTPVPAQAGYLSEIPLIEPNVVQGIINGNSLSLPNPPMPGAYYRGGYFGIRDEQGEDEYSLVKMFRFTRLSGSIPDGFRLQASVVDGDTQTFDNPGVFDMKADGNLFGLNQKGRALSPTILFPSDAQAVVTTLMQAWRVTGER